jgi:hypothetical protein
MSARKDVGVPETDVERRQFLSRAGKFAAVTPPAITMMLTASTVPAYAKSSGFNSGEGNGNEGGDPGNSGAHNQVVNNSAEPNSAAAQNELDDPEEPN